MKVIETRETAVDDLPFTVTSSFSPQGKVPAVHDSLDIFSPSSASPASSPPPSQGSIRPDTDGWIILFFSLLVIVFLVYLGFETVRNACLRLRSIAGFGAGIGTPATTGGAPAGGVPAGGGGPGVGIGAPNLAPGLSLLQPLQVPQAFFRDRRIIQAFRAA
jgi:hypothetical protein